MSIKIEERIVIGLMAIFRDGYGRVRQLDQKLDCVDQGSPTMNPFFSHFDFWERVPLLEVTKSAHGLYTELGVKHWQTYSDAGLGTKAVYTHGQINTNGLRGANMESGRRLIITEMLLENFKSYAGAQRVGPFHKVFLWGNRDFSWHTFR